MARNVRDQKTVSEDFAKSVVEGMAILQALKGVVLNYRDPSQNNAIKRIHLIPLQNLIQDLMTDTGDASRMASQAQQLGIAAVGSAAVVMDALK